MHALSNILKAPIPSLSSDDDELSVSLSSLSLLSLLLSELMFPSESLDETTERKRTEKMEKLRMAHTASEQHEVCMLGVVILV